MRASDYLARAAALRAEAGDAIFAGSRRRLRSRADDYEHAGRTALEAERAQRAAAWDAEQAERRAQAASWDARRCR